MNKRQEKYFKRLKNCVSEKRGKCLSNIYVDCKTELKFQCSEGHIWKTKPTNITCHGNWCYVCSKNKQRTNINDIIKIVQNKGGELLTKEYKNCKQKLKIKCSKEHIWDMSYASLHNGSWCPVCSFDRKRNKIENISEMIKSKGGELLTKEYINDIQKLEIKCSKGHIWRVNYGCLRSGNWCPTCALLSKHLTYEERLKSFNDICKIAGDKGGKCLSQIEDYKNIRSRLKFQCFKKHEWETMGTTIRDNNRWCPTCCQSLSEKLFRCVLEKVFNCSFPSVRPSWLKNEGGYRLEIDGYNEDLKLGFEHQGEQHFKFSSHFHKTTDMFQRRQHNDKTKANILQSRNIFMLYPTYRLKKEDYFNFVEDKIKGTIYESSANFDQKININELYSSI